MDLSTGTVTGDGPGTAGAGDPATVDDGFVTEDTHRPYYIAARRIADAFMIAVRARDLGLSWPLDWRADDVDVNHAPYTMAGIELVVSDEDVVIATPLGGWRIAASDGPPLDHALDAILDDLRDVGIKFGERYETRAGLRVYPVLRVGYLIPPSTVSPFTVADAMALDPATALASWRRHRQDYDHGPLLALPGPG